VDLKISQKQVIYNNIKITRDPLNINI